MAYIGWLGAVIFIAAYLLLSLEYISAKTKWYHILNGLGAVCLVINAFYLDDYPNIVVNGVWGMLALIAVYKRKHSVKETASTSKVKQP
ncbi:CBU_0592 family membrane protein [Leeuwenhoekiella marinoflava]|uniref:CBU_0592 family membrane protein n=1 Tax=Leeuwenhoekiella marinoflava TaxID=988 RepID=UPI0030011BCD